MNSSSRARLVIDAVGFASSVEIPSFHRLIAQNPDALPLTIILRILLTYLPESTEPGLYTELLRQLYTAQVREPLLVGSILTKAELELSDREAQHQARQLHLLPIAYEQDVQSGCSNTFILFLLHRARRIEVETGSIPLVQQLLEPFLDQDNYLRTWFISNILPLLRLDFEYYTHNSPSCTLNAFEKLEGRPAIDFLMSESTQCKGEKAVQTGRDLRGLIGPWAFGEKNRKRRKTHHGRRKNSVRISEQSSGTFEQGEATVTDHENEETAWMNVNEWILDLTIHSFSLAMDTLMQWNGPTDVDYGGYEDQAQNSRGGDINALADNYMQASLASIYASREISAAALETSLQVLRKLAFHSDLPEPLNLDEPDISSITVISKSFLDSLSKTHLLHNALLRPQNPLTSTNKSSLLFASLLLSSCYILQKLGHPKTLKAATELGFFGGHDDQLAELRRILQQVPVRTRDEQSWTRVRQQITWLRDWYYNISRNGTYYPEPSIGIFRKVKRVETEIEVLKAFLRASCYDLSVHTYCMQEEYLIPLDVLEKTVLSVAMSFYDGATNGNRTRGGLRKASEIITSFQPFFPESNAFQQANALLSATHSMSFYSLVLEHGVPFQPVNIRAHKDPMSLVGKILSQNQHSYTKLDDLLDIGRNLVLAGFTPGELDNSLPHFVSEVDGNTDQDHLLLTSRRRITSMAIEAALSEGDFDTAYSYIVNRLSPTVPTPSKGLNTEPDNNDLENQDADDVSWRAAYLAGRSANPNSSSLHRLEQRLELLSLSLLVAPSSKLPEILPVWRSVEDDVNACLACEALAEDTHDRKGDRGSSTLPGGFVPSLAELDKAANDKSRRRSRATTVAEEAPMGLFDVARGAAQAFSKNAFPLKAATAGEGAGDANTNVRNMSSPIGSDNGGDGKERIRKRDMVASAVTGGLASGIGWVIGAPPAANNRT